MKSAITLALAATALAEWDPLPFKRDVATIQAVIQSTTTSLQGLDDAVNAFNGQDFTPLATSAANVKNALVQGTSQIQATTAITAQEAITLQSTLGPVQQLGTKLSTDLVAKKDQIQAASLCTIVQQQSADIGNAANGLITATVSKVPQELQSVAGQVTSQFTGQLNDLALQFAPGNCTNAAGGSAATAGISMGNSSAQPGTTTSGLGRSSGSTVVSSVFGIVVAAAAGVLML